jgi:hypothetical protein
MIALLIDYCLASSKQYFRGREQYGGRRWETTIVSDWKQAWNQFNNQNWEKIQIEEL